MEHHISREALSGSLETFRLRGIGTSQSFSKSKQRGKKPRSKLASKIFSIKIGKLVQKSKAFHKTAVRFYQPRYLLHAGILTGGALVVIAGGTGTRGNVALLGSNSGFGAELDSAATANVVATVADRTHMLVAEDATKQATTVNAQVALPTTADATLAKRQVVTTAGNATRDISTYTVQNGDTLSGIASKFGITSSTVKWANGLDDVNALKPGQTLTILPVTGILYTVKEGDTADSLASKYQSNAAQIISYNNAEVKGLSVGAKVILPDAIIQDAPKAAPQQTAIAAAPTQQRSSNVTQRLTPFSGGGNSYSYGYCTWYVANRRAVPAFWGNAVNWYYNAQASGFGVGSTPVPGAIGWTPSGYYGHVVYVESVSGGTVTVSEMNYNGNWGRATRRTVAASTFRYIY